MAKFMSSHTMPAGALKREQVDQMAQAAQSDPVVKPYRSFLNLAEGKVFCVMEAPSKEGQVLPVHLHTRVTEVGTLELWAISRDGKQRWKLEYNVRERRE